MCRNWLFVVIFVDDASRFGRMIIYEVGERFLAELPDYEDVATGGNDIEECEEM